MLMVAMLHSNDALNAHVTPNGRCIHIECNARIHDTIRTKIEIVWAATLKAGRAIRHDACEEAERHMLEAVQEAARRRSALTPPNPLKVGILQQLGDAAAGSVDERARAGDPFDPV